MTIQANIALMYSFVLYYYLKLQICFFLRSVLARLLHIKVLMLVAGCRGCYSRALLIKTSHSEVFL